MSIIIPSHKIECIVHEFLLGQEALMTRKEMSRARKATLQIPI